ncbi:hypothetical protein [Deinococcus sp. SL84]|uniref:hypothetical protein n=1 Tax=Deinococcus sp. SL84 TaxID=2994663 RepID=UPI0022725A40|nr:hypothetical protein [Deinococcus sp. SL84]MCY1704350.1 hypothetical protein [Deinococcus sp. SL84]
METNSKREIQKVIDSLEKLMLQETISLDELEDALNPLYRLSHSIFVKPENTRPSLLSIEEYVKELNIARSLSEKSNKVYSLLASKEYLSIYRREGGEEIQCLLRDISAKVYFLADINYPTLNTLQSADLGDIRIYFRGLGEVIL